MRELSAVSSLPDFRASFQAEYDSSTRAGLLVHAVPWWRLI